MRSLFVITGSVLGLIIFAPNVTRAQLTTSTLREVNYNAAAASDTVDNFDPGLFTNTVGFGTTPIAPSASASQNSFVSDTSYTGSGASDIHASDASSPINSLSLYSITFTVTSAVPYNVTGSLSATTQGAFAESSLSLTGPGTSLFFEAATDTGVPAAPISGSGTLQPGDYNLDVIATTGDSNAVGTFGADSAFQFSLSLVPEPASLGLLSTGVLVFRRRR